jgi:sortase (surface protein transpeptidase)
LQASLDSTITMVACVPAYIYDQRLLVTAKLVGVKG